MVWRSLERNHAIPVLRNDYVVAMRKHTIHNDRQSIDAQANHLQYTRQTIGHAVARMEKKYDLSKSSEIEETGKTVAFLQD